MTLEEEKIMAQQLGLQASTVGDTGGFDPWSNQDPARSVVRPKKKRKRRFRRETPDACTER